MAENTKNESRVLASKTQLISILEASPIGVSISPYYDGTIFYVNSSLANLWGGPAEELLRTDSIDYYHDPDDIAWAIGELRQHRDYLFRYPARRRGHHHPAGGFGHVPGKAFRKGPGLLP